jgi:hypothetical protein
VTDSAVLVLGCFFAGFVLGIFQPILFRFFGISGQKGGV